MRLEMLDPTVGTRLLVRVTDGIVLAQLRNILACSGETLLSPVRSGFVNSTYGERT